MARTADPQLHTLWRERLRRQVDSGLTIAQFCDQEGLSAATFHSWKRRLRLVELADTTPTPPAPPTFLPVTTPTPPAPPAFLPVTVRLAEPAPTDASPIVADLPNGIRLRIPTADARLACRIVRAVACARTNAGGLR
jgi:hypothetical protein